jgi:hypothetical protein
VDPTRGALAIAAFAGCSVFTSFDEFVEPTGEGIDGGANGGDANDVAAPDAPAQPVDASSDAPAPPIVFVQGHVAMSTSATVSVTLAQPVGAGHALVVCFEHDNSRNVKSVTDTLGHGFRIVVGPVQSSSDIRGYVYAAFDTKAGDDTVTFVLDGSPTYLQAYVHEYSGLAPGDSFDDGTYRSGSSSAMESGPATSTSARSLVLGFGYAYTLSTTNGIVLPGAGFSQRFSDFGNVTEDRIVTGPGIQNATAIMTDGDDWTMLMAIFKGR